MSPLKASIVCSHFVLHVVYTVYGILWVGAQCCNDR